jgi:2-dehydropantoate 2-reductase
VVGSEAVLGATAYVSAIIESPGVIAHSAGGRLVVGELDGGVSPRTEQLRARCKQAGIPVELHPDIRVAIWGKFIANCGLNGMTALIRLPNGVIQACPASRALYRQVLEEVEAVARAHGINVPEDIVERSIFKAQGIYGSMYYDLVAGKRLELEALNGTVVRRAQRLDIPVPVNAVIYAALQPYAAGTPTLP